MGRSFARVLPDNTPEFGKPFHHKASDSYFAMIARDGKLYQRRWQIGFDGKETNVDEKQADFVVGSGNHSKTYLHLTSRGALQVLPLSWYSEKGGYWDMSPGYDQPDFPGSVRPVHYECMFCHNAYPKIPERARTCRQRGDDLSRSRFRKASIASDAMGQGSGTSPSLRRVASRSKSGPPSSTRSGWIRIGNWRYACNATWRQPV